MTKRNASSLSAFASWAHAQGLGFRLSPVRLPRPPTVEELEVVSEHTSSLYFQLGRKMPTSLNFERDARFAEWNLRKKKMIACGSCRNYLAVSETGEIRSCQMAVASNFNIHTHTIDQALVGFRLKADTELLAQPHLKAGPCTTCEYYHVCCGGCPQHTTAVYGTSDIPSPWCSLFGTLIPIYVKAKAHHLWRQVLAFRCGQSLDDREA